MLVYQNFTILTSVCLQEDGGTSWSLLHAQITQLSGQYSILTKCCIAINANVESQETFSNFLCKAVEMLLKTKHFKDILHY